MSFPALPGRSVGLTELLAGGARPRMGTPPFAPTGWEATGGANIPTTPDTHPQKRGLAGFFDRALNPTNALGQFGQALLASSGGPIGNAMGYLMQAHAAEAHKGDKFAEFKQQHDYEVAHPKPSTAGPHYWESNDGSLHAIGPDGQATELYHDPNPKMNFIPDGKGGGQWVPVPSLTSGSTPQGVTFTPIEDPAAAALAPAGVVPGALGMRGGARGNAGGNFLGL